MTSICGKVVLALPIAVVLLSAGEVRAYGETPTCSVDMLIDYWRPGHTHPKLVQWTPDGSQILFDWDMRLYLADADGSRVRWIVDGATDRLPTDLARVPNGRITADISPDGTRVAHATCLYTNEFRNSDFLHTGAVTERIQYEIASANLDGSYPERLTDNRFFDHFPVWSPDGTRLAFLSGDHPINLHTMASDGTDRKQIADAISPHPPVWSPDGSRIAFVDFEWNEETLRRQHVIYTIAPDGSDLTRMAVATSGPSWSPDGNRMAFTRTLENAEVGLYTISAHSSISRLVTSFGDDVGPWAPSWSPTVPI